MSTTDIDSWAVDLADVSVIYPLQGTEVIMVIIAVVFWIGWHIWQAKHEEVEFKDIHEQHVNEENLKKSIHRDD